MRIVIIVLVLAAAGLGAWLVFGAGPGEPGGAYESGPEEGTEARPELEGMRVDAGPAPDATENPGRAEIVGSVRLGGVPTAAALELRVVARVEGDGASAMFSTLGKVFVERLLDGGVGKGGALDTTRAGDDGAFRFKGLGPGLYEVRARDADDRRAVAAVSVPADGARVQVTVELPSGDISLTGRVVYDDGTPFRGTVVVSPAAGQMSPFLPARGPQAQTDADGHFTLGGLAPGAVIVTAVAPGSIRAMGLPIQLPHEGPYTLTIGAGGVAVKGKVVASETMEPIPGATVIAGGGSPGAGFLVRTTTADEEGRFELKVPGTQGGMLAMAPGYGTGMVELRNERPEDLVVPLPKLAIVTGQLSEKGSGDPLPGVPVYAIPSEAFGGFSFPSHGVTDADGRYRMEDVNPGPVMIFAYGRGWVTEGLGQMSMGRGGGVSASVLTLKPGEETEKDLEAIPAGAVSGRVLSVEGKPVPGAVVSLMRQNDFLMRISMMMGMSSGLVTSVTDRDGRYHIDAVVPDSGSHLSTEAVGFAAARTPTFQVASGDTSTQDITLEGARWFTLTVVDADSGEPVANAMITMATKGEERREDVRMGMPGSFFTTDAQGRARVGPLSKGAPGARAEAGGYLGQDDWVWFDEAATEGTLKLRKGLQITGRVILPEGMQAGQVEVQARYSGSGGWQREETAPNADGRFVLAGLKPGRFRLTARGVMPGRRFEAKAEGIEAGASDVELVLEELERGSMLTVRVLDAEGTPVARAQVSLQKKWKNGGSGSSSRMMSAGRVTFELDDEREPDEMSIEIFRVAGGRGGALIHSGLPYEGGEVELRLPEPKTIRGRIAAGGKPVAGVQVEAHAIRPGTDGDTTNQHGVASSDDEGVYVLEGLGPYDYQLRVRAPSQYAPVAPLRASAGATAVDVSLEIGATAVITVLDDAGKPVPGAHVSASPQQGDGKQRPSGGESLSATSAADGTARLEGLPVGATFLLSVNPPQSRDDLRRFGEQGWRPVDRTVQLERAYTISGVVRDKRGVEVSGGSVQAKAVETEGQRFSAQVDDKGRFTLKQLPDAEFELTYDAEGSLNRFGPGGPEKKSLRARPGAKNVALVADLGLTLTVTIGDWTGERSWHHANLQEDGGGAHAWTRIQDDGTVRFNGLQEGKTYAFSIMGLPGGRYVYRAGIRPGETLRLRSEQGKPVTGRLNLPAEASDARMNVSIQGPGFGLAGEVDDQGRFKVEGVPEGMWTIRAWARSEAGGWFGEAEVRAGGEVEISLRKQG